MEQPEPVGLIDQLLGQHHLGAFALGLAVFLFRLQAEVDRVANAVVLVYEVDLALERPQVVPCVIFKGQILCLVSPDYGETKMAWYLQ